MGIVNNLVVTKQGALLLDLLKVQNGIFTKFIIGEGYCYLSSKKIISGLFAE